MLGGKVVTIKFIRACLDLAKVLIHIWVDWWKSLSYYWSSKYNIPLLKILAVTTGYHVYPFQILYGCHVWYGASTTITCHCCRFLPTCLNSPLDFLRSFHSPSTVYWPPVNYLRVVSWFYCMTTFSQFASYWLTFLPPHQNVHRCKPTHRWSSSFVIISGWDAPVIQHRHGLLKPFRVTIIMIFPVLIPNNST